MAELIIMPKLGFNMDEGKLVKWYKDEGDNVTKGEPVFAIETDKTSIDIEATADGVFRRKFIEEGDTVAVTLPIAIVGDANEDISALEADVAAQLGGGSPAAEPVAESAPAAEQAPQEQTSVEAVPMSAADGNLKVTPRARRVAAENGLDVNSINIVGTGYDGGICEKDILEYLESNHVKASPLANKIANAEGVDLNDVNGTGHGGKVMKGDVLAAMNASNAQASSEASEATCGADSEAQFTSDGKELLEVIPYDGIRKVIGDRLAESKFTAPHLYFTQKVNLEELLKFRKQVNEAQDKKTSVTDYITKAVVKTLVKYPDINSSLVGETIEKYKTVNIGIAVAAPGGLIVPNVKNAEQKSLIEISTEASALFEKAREGKLSMDEYTGGTFTISNLGMFGIENFTAIINPPEVAILAVSATKDEPVVVTDKNGEKTIAIKPMMNITLTVNHKLIDGLLAAEFVTEVKRVLENPLEVML